MTALSVGEKAYSGVFRFFEIVPRDEHKILADFLYKYSFNYREAQDYLNLLKQVQSIETKKKSELLYRIYGMSLQSFALCVRKLTDQPSERSSRKLISKIVNDVFRDKEMNKIAEIYKHYKFYLDKFVVHQDAASIQEALQAFPDIDIIELDMEHLKNLYLKIVIEICRRYMDIEVEPHDYMPELQKLALK